MLVEGRVVLTEGCVAHEFDTPTRECDTPTVSVGVPLPPPRTKPTAHNWSTVPKRLGTTTLQDFTHISFKKVISYVSTSNDFLF